MISSNEAIYINKRKVTTYLMKVGGGLSAPLSLHLNAASLCFWESNWKLFSGDVCTRKNTRRCTYRTNACHFKRHFTVQSVFFFQTDTTLVQAYFLSYLNAASPYTRKHLATSKSRNVFKQFNQLMSELS